MKLGTKIALGFTALIAIALLLGGMSIWKMNGVVAESSKLADEYVPEVKVAVDLSGAANRTMYEMRGYGLSEEDSYYTQAYKEMTAVNKHLQDAAELADRAVHLKALKGQVAQAQDAADTYAELMEQTKQAIARLNTERESLNENAAAYMENCADFLDGQNKNFKTDLDERQKKVELVTDIVDLGTHVRVTNFKAQGTQDMALMAEAISLLNTLSTYTGPLRALTKDAEDIERIDETEAAAKKYAQNMAAYIETNEALVEAGKKMDSNAAAYMKNCSDFLNSQNEAMRRDFNQQGANLEERLKKITLVNDIIDAGNAVRVGNYKAQASQDPELMQQAMDEFQSVKNITANLRKITRDEANIRHIDETEAAADAYVEAMQQYLTNYLKLEEHRREMDAAAGQYVAQCDTFLANQQSKLSADMRERHEKITLVNDIIDLGNDARIKAYKAQALRSPAIMEEAISNFPKLNEKYAALRKITHLDADLKRIDDTKAAGEEYAAGLNAFLTQWKELQDLGRQRTEAGNNVLASCVSTADAGIENTDQIAQAAAAALTSATTVMFVGLAVAIVVGVLLAFFITRGITKPLNRMISGLNEGADQVNDAAGQVSSASQQLAEGASEQASSLEETSSALEQMAAMTRTNAENAREANNLSGQARDAAQNGDRTMDQLNNAMAGINESSGQISKIIKVIEEIAFQTNLLALNAAVEAARAGEHGKGFAVVADEVRNLAQRCAQAARETTTLIEDSVNRAKEGTEVAGEVAKALSAIVGDVTKVTDLIDGITKASEEQAQGVDQVNMAVSQMDKVTQQNAAGAEESASAAEELSAQAQSMKGVVDELSALVSGARAEAMAAAPTKSRSPGRDKNRLHVNVAHLKKDKPQKPAHSEPVTANASTATSGKSSPEFMDMDHKNELNDF